MAQLVKNLPAMQETDPGLIPGSGRSPGEGIGYSFQYSWASLLAQAVKNLPALQETWVRSLGWEDPSDNPLQYSCLENPHGPRSLAGYSLWGCKELDIAERPSIHLLDQLRMRKLSAYSAFTCFFSCSSFLCIDPSF